MPGAPMAGVAAHGMAVAPNYGFRPAVAARPPAWPEWRFR